MSTPVPTLIHPTSRHRAKWSSRTFQWVAAGPTLSLVAAIAGCGGGDSAAPAPSAPQATADSQCAAFLGRSFEGATTLCFHKADRLFGSSRTHALSQLPMLILMVGFTTFGLWILSLPFAPAT